jgi:hypothetical protein
VNPRSAMLVESLPARDSSHATDMSDVQCQRHTLISLFDGHVSSEQARHARRQLVDGLMCEAAQRCADGHSRVNASDKLLSLSSLLLMAERCRTGPAHAPAAGRRPGSTRSYELCTADPKHPRLKNADKTILHPKGHTIAQQVKQRSK